MGTKFKSEKFTLLELNKQQLGLLKLNISEHSVSLLPIWYSSERFTRRCFKRGLLWELFYKTKRKFYPSNNYAPLATTLLFRKLCDDCKCVKSLSRSSKHLYCFGLLSSYFGSKYVWHYLHSYLRTNVICFFLDVQRDEDRHSFKVGLCDNARRWVDKNVC